MSSGKVLGFEEIKEGDELPVCQVKMDRENYMEYNRLVNEINPIHFDVEHARKLGFRDIVIAGVFTFSFIPRMIEEWLGKQGTIEAVEITYHNPVYIEDVISHKAHVRKKSVKDNKPCVELEVSVDDNEGNVLTSAIVTACF